MVQILLSALMHQFWKGMPDTFYHSIDNSVISGMAGKKSMGSLLI
jgi:hypothetical protein